MDGRGTACDDPNAAGWKALVATVYGQLVLAKASGPALLFLLAMLNHLYLTAALVRNGAPVLSRSIRAEVGVAALVLGATAVLGLTAPRAAPTVGNAARRARQALAAAHSVAVAANASGLDLVLEVTPARAGSNRLTLEVKPRNGKPLTAREVWLELSQTEAGVAGLRRRMRAETPGRCSYKGTELAVPSHWTARVEVLVSDFEQVAVELGFDIASTR
ncbi:CopD family protein [Falsiroseomonas sp. HW251]|uniref:CopD family protein n=1 Tax=Falsiroseomonas sp. HW251 TaxID=3390998 RepID=UPI003D315A27